MYKQLDILVDAQAHPFEPELKNQWSVEIDHVSLFHVLHNIHGITRKV